MCQSIWRLLCTFVHTFQRWLILEAILLSSSEMLLTREMRYVPCAHKVTSRQGWANICIRKQHDAMWGHGCRHREAGDIFQVSARPLNFKEKDAWLPDLRVSTIWSWFPGSRNQWWLSWPRPAAISPTDCPLNHFLKTDVLGRINRLISEWNTTKRDTNEQTARWSRKSKKLRGMHRQTDRNSRRQTENKVIFYFFQTERTTPMNVIQWLK